MSRLHFIMFIEALNMTQTLQQNKKLNFETATKQFSTLFFQINDKFISHCFPKKNQYSVSGLEVNFS